ncbi:MAG TPA: flagellar motor stator protein MotA [Polyangiaceae bacterium]|nr:flagellar motor stator protein MotA [Polyangiaceae bacterium]
MSTIIGLLVVIGSVLGGFAMSGGPLAVLFQPNELVVIGGAAVGSLIVSAPGKVGKRVLAALRRGFKVQNETQQDYLDLLKLLYQLFQVVRREGLLALEGHVSDPASSSIISRYPSVMQRHHALTFLLEGLKQMVDGCTVDELAQMFDAELETLHDQEHQPITLMRTTSDALPGLGIVAAVLGIIITMAHMDGPPEQIGHHVAAALVGTFLGILLCYGVLSPIAANVEIQAQSSTRYLTVIKNGLLAAARGANPAVAIELARRAIFTDERPSAEELEKEFQSLRNG